mmetsp:Transcript_42295/g.122299  ORF Transcript_42295/g.122299 Transcript_42295/m.122299 type:complete len:342 (-) Transcript_42295:113-1138(-)
MSALPPALGLLALAAGAAGVALMMPTEGGFRQGARLRCDPELDSAERGPSVEDVSGPALGVAAIQEDEREYMHNLSHVRECNSSSTHTDFLHPLVLPEYKLAFCYIPKVACTDFKDLFNTINGFGKHTLGFGHDYEASMSVNNNITESEMTRKNGWKFAAFTRDPALRYLSAFGDTCLYPNLHPHCCCGPLVFRGLPKEEMLKRFKARLGMDLELGTAKDEQHWAQQTDVLDVCGWHKFKPSHLDFWGSLSGDMNAQVKEMLRLVGYVNDSVVSTFFPETGAAGHHGYLKGTPMDYINDLETLEGLMKLYEEDYRLLPGVGCAFTEPLLARLRAQRGSAAS